MPQKPKLTRKVLEGLTTAYSRMEADDIFDLDDKEQEEFEAAGKWLKDMWQFYQEDKQS